MLKRTPVIIVLLSIIGFGLAIAIPFSVLSFNFSSYDSIEETLVYEYLPDSPSDKESLYLNLDYGNVIIDYVDPPIDYLVKIEVNIEMRGAGLVGKSYLDYFNITKSDLSSSPIDFSIKLLPSVTESEVKPLLNDISVIIYLRKDKTFNIFTNVKHGKVDIEIPFNVRIDNVYINILDGDILFDLKNCIIEGNITGIGNQSNIELRTRDIQLTKNSFWYFKNSEGLIKFDIDQLGEMGANVTAIGELETSNANCQIYYDDFSSNIGAIVTLNDWNDWLPAQCYAIGFDNESIDSPPVVFYKLTSYDFPAHNNFNISLYRKSDLCIYTICFPYFWYLSSIPN
jgi:hypothetical protein